jgi:UDPglucose 6-dehydrogenase
MLPQGYACTRALASRVLDASGTSVAGRTVALLGVAFKASTDDIRESPAVALLARVAEMGAVVRAHDPKAMENARRRFPDVVWCADPYQACDGAEIVVIATEWPAFRGLDLGRLRLAMAGDLLVDLRNMFKPDDVAAAGLRYVSIGRPAVDGHAIRRPAGRSGVAGVRIEPSLGVGETRLEEVAQRKQAARGT